MARKGKQKHVGKQNLRVSVGSSTHSFELQKIQNAIDKADLITAYQLAKEFTSLHANNPNGWEMLANVQARQQDLKSACRSMTKAIECAKGGGILPELKLAQYELFAGDTHQSIRRLKVLSTKVPTEKRVWTWLSRAYYVVGQGQDALTANEKAYALDRKDPDTLLWRSRIFDHLKRHSDAYETAKTLKKLKPTQVGVSNHLASLSLREGDYIAAEKHFNDELAISRNAATAYNALIGKHYNPEYTAEELSEIAVQWQAAYITEKHISRAITEQRKSKRIRIGLLSNSFRTHPVSQMILPALQQVDKREVELFCYTTSQVEDHLTHEIQKATDHWISVVETTDEQLNQKIRHDSIDILIDMNGGGEGSRFTALAKEPAPLIVKWVGMLVGTTGLKCFDYLLSDSIETPKNVDHLYTEKLIRLPDDYVCYHLPKYIPEVNSLPALSNRFITFGCLNNPAKLSSPLIKEWSALLSDIPNSKLLLRGIQFEREAFCKRIRSRFAEFGIDPERLLLEGPAKHQEFIATYQRIDIALDTWPYSGGLTTCEALAMGVPVVTCVGPTFAGRHSATHLANAGLPELVTDNWDDFRKRAKELAADLPSLAVIRAALRTILKESPVCDGERFAQHFTKAMRGIWQRHCDGKAPEALTFNKEGDAWFSDGEEPIELAEVDNEPESNQADFEWNLKSPILVIDNGALFARQEKFPDWLQTENFAVITFDPGSLMTNQAEELKQLGEWHHYPHATLGDGTDKTLYVTLKSELTGTLEPLTSRQTGIQKDPLRVLSTLPISTVALDAVEGLAKIDLLVLNEFNDAISILKNSGEYRKEFLLVQVNVVLDDTHENQVDLQELHSWAKDNNFLLYGFKEQADPAYILKDTADVSDLADRFVSAKVLLLPNPGILKNLSKERCLALLFIFNKVYDLDVVSFYHENESELDALWACIENYFYEIDLKNISNEKAKLLLNGKGNNAPISVLDIDRASVTCRLKAALGKRKFVFINTGSMANYGIVQKGQKYLFDILCAAECQVEYLNISDISTRNLIKMIASENYVFYGANRLFDMSINVSGYGGSNLFQEFNCPVIGTINDHPYANFMLERVSKAPSNGLFLARGSLGDELKFIRPDLKFVVNNLLETMPEAYTDCDKPHKDRDIDILVPMNISYALNYESLLSNLMSMAAGFGGMYEKLVKNILSQYKDFSYSLLHTFREVYKKVFDKEWFVQTPWSVEDVKLLKLIGQLDDVLRGEKRLQSFKMLSLCDPSANVVVLAPPEMQGVLYKKLGEKSILNWKFIGFQSFDELRKLYTRSRYVLNVSPTYHDLLHERIRVAAVANCVLITNVNERASDLLSHGENVIFYENDGVENSYSSDAQVSEKIGKAGCSLLKRKLFEVEDGLNFTFLSYANYLNDFEALESEVEIEPEKLSNSSKLPDSPHMSVSEARAFMELLRKSKSYFEFGSGGSTVWAVQQGLVVRGVETDKKWVDALKKGLGEKCQIEFVDIGPVGDWGAPISDEFSDRYGNYSQSISYINDELDLILIDGRFRVACILASIRYIVESGSRVKNCLMFVHDFWNRPAYHVVLDFLDEVDRIDTAGVFKVRKNVSVKKIDALYRQYVKDYR